MLYIAGDIQFFINNKQDEWFGSVIWKVYRNNETIYICHLEFHLSLKTQHHN